MKKEIFLITLLGAIVAVHAKAQLIDGSSEAVVQRPKEIEVQRKEPDPAVQEAEEAKAREEAEKEAEIRYLLKTTDQPSPTIEPARKVYLKNEGKRDIKDSVKDQKDDKIRRRMVDAFTRGERVQKRRQALLEGKDRDEAVKESKKIKTPQLNVKDDMEVSKYVYKKVGLDDEQ
ncbi:MAG: hypothetical protein PUH03_00310 [bacterium]|nr:hypothetical protein [bacterium]MDY2830851.1 hypothetical protein [Alphaproteobacteria bacterium]